MQDDTFASHFTVGGTLVGPFFDNGAGTRYAIFEGNKHVLGSEAANSWGASSTNTLGLGTLAQFSDGAAATSAVQINGADYLLSGGLLHASPSANMLANWGVSSGMTIPAIFTG